MLDYHMAKIECRRICEGIKINKPSCYIQVVAVMMTIRQGFLAVTKVISFTTASGLFQNKSKQVGRGGGVRIHFFEKPYRNFSFFYFTLEILDKTKLNPGQSIKLCYIPWKFQGQKKRPLWQSVNSTLLFLGLVTLEIPLRF